MTIFPEYKQKYNNAKSLHRILYIFWLLSKYLVQNHFRHRHQKDPNCEKIVEKNNKTAEHVQQILGIFIFILYTFCVAGMQIAFLLRPSKNYYHNSYPWLIDNSIYSFVHICTFDYMYLFKLHLPKYCFFLKLNISITLSKKGNKVEINKMKKRKEIQ